MVSACTGEQTQQGTTVDTSPFGTTADGRQITAYTLRNAAGMEVQIINYGAIIQSLYVPDRDGRSADVVLGFDDLASYKAPHPYFGAVVGRYGNRIAGALLELDGEIFRLAANNGPNHLHGGEVGLDKRVWDADILEDADSAGVVLRYLSPHGEEGYPGSLDITVTYRLTNDNALVVHYAATTDRPTPVNLTQHSYFNLAGHDAGDILNHELMINAEAFTPVDETLIPTGEIRDVEGTPFDFREWTPIGAHIDADHEQLRFGNGYDHNFVLNRSPDSGLALAARLRDPDSGRTMEVWTTEPGVQFYAGNFLTGSNIGKGGSAYQHRGGLCLETQHFPDSPNQPDFPSTIITPEDAYDTRTVFRFSVDD
jgi:aldose 1-epimerase